MIRSYRKSFLIYLLMLGGTLLYISLFSSYVEEVIILAIVIVFQALASILYDKILLDIRLTDKELILEDYNFAFGTSTQTFEWNEIVNIQCSAKNLELTVLGTNGPYSVKFPIRSDAWSDLNVKLNTLKIQWELRMADLLDSSVSTAS